MYFHLRLNCMLYVQTAVDFGGFISFHVKITHKFLNNLIM